MIASQTRGLVDHAGLAAVTVEIFLGTGDKERQLLCDGIQAREVDVSLVHHVERTRFDGQIVENGHIGGFSVSYADKTGNVATQIDQCV